MPADIDADSDELSSQWTRFIERPDDAETLWEVQEIVGERTGKYRVRWVGVDEEGNPWPLDWVPKEDCTDPLVKNWKKKKLEKKKLAAEARNKSRNSRPSLASTTSKGSIASTSTITHATVSKSKATTRTKRKNDDDNNTPKPSSIISLNSDSDILLSSRPKKRPKLASRPSTGAVTAPHSPNVPSRKHGNNESTKNNLSRSTTKPNPRRPQRRADIFDSDFDSDQEPPSNDFLKRQQQSRSTTTTSHAVVTDSISGLATPASKLSSRGSSKRLDRNDGEGDEEDEEDEEEVPTPKVPAKRQLGATSRKSQPVKPAGVITTRPPPTNRQRERQPARKAYSVAQLSSSSTSTSSQTSNSRSPTPPERDIRISSPPPPLPILSSSPRARKTTPLFMPSSSSSRSVSPKQSQDDIVMQNGTNGEIISNEPSQNIESSGDGDSALEYADIPLPTLEVHPPSSPPSPPLSSVPQHRKRGPPPPPPPPAAAAAVVRLTESSPSPPPLSEILKGRTELEPEVIPETEGEESQERHQYVEPLHAPTPLVPPTTTKLLRSPSKNSLLSKMKPRSPGAKRNIPDADVIASPLPLPFTTTPPERQEPSRSKTKFTTTATTTTTANVKTKPLHPIPHISPSKFIDLPSSSLIESIETTRDRHHDDDIIEQFESPDKSGLSSRNANVNGKKKKKSGVVVGLEGRTQELSVIEDGGDESVSGSGSGSGSGGGSLPIPPAAMDVMNKGVAMAADVAKRLKQQQQQQGGGGDGGVVSTTTTTTTQAVTTQRVPLSVLFEKKIKARRKPRFLSPSSSPFLDKEDVDGENDDDGDEGVRIPGEQERDDDVVVESALEEFEDSFLDYEGGMGQQQQVEVDVDVDVDMDTTGLSRTQDETMTSKEKEKEKEKFVRQEEEESTQDLIMELQQQQHQERRAVLPDANEGWGHPTSSVPTPPTPVPVPLVPISSEQQQQQSSSSDHDIVNAIDSLEVAPKSSAPQAETSSSLEDSLKPSVPSQQSLPVPPLPSQDHSVDSTMMIPATLSPTRPDQVTPLSTQTPSGGTQQLGSAMELLHQKSEEISRLENLLSTAQFTIQSLQVTNAKLQEQFTFSEKNAELFRERYFSASAFGTEMADENVELKERCEMMESQVNYGLESIKEMYEMRMKKNEEEMEYHKRVTTFLMEQSCRTGDEEIRRKAAEYPEMEMRYEGLQKKYEGLEALIEGARGMIDVLEKQVTQRDKEIETLRMEKGNAQEEFERLKRELEGLKSRSRDGEMVERGEEEAKVNRQEEVGDSAMMNEGGAVSKATGDDVNLDSEKVDKEIQVYRCLWRQNGTERCDAMFLTQEALCHHIEYGGHIP